MNAQIKLNNNHRSFIRLCMKQAGYPAVLARECKLNPTIFRDWQEEGKTMAWGTMIALVEYARRSGVVGPYFDPITLQEPPANYDLDKEVSEAAWMLQRLALPDRERIINDVAATYGKQVARERDGQAKLA